MGAGPVEIGCANFRPLNSVPCRAACQMLILSRGYFVKIALDLLQNGDRKKMPGFFPAIEITDDGS